MSFKERKFNLLLKRTQNRINRQISQGSCTQPSPYKESVIQLWSVCLIWQLFELDALSDATLGIYPGLGLVLGVYWLPMAGLDEKVNNTLFTCPTLGQHWVYWQDWDLKKNPVCSQSLQLLGAVVRKIAGPDEVVERVGMSQEWLVFHLTNEGCWSKSKRHQSWWKMRFYYLIFQPLEGCAAYTDSHVCLRQRSCLWLHVSILEA